MNASFNKNGIVQFGGMYESQAMELHYSSNPGDRDTKTYSYTPTTTANSTHRVIPVHGSLYPKDEVMHARFKVTWNGFDESNTDGTFNIYFQGLYYTNGSNATFYTPLGAKADSVQNLKSLVLSATSGEYIYDFTYSNIAYDTQEGVRCDYSNGTASISFSDITVIPEKYYISSTHQDNFTALHMGSNYISAGEFIEI